MFKSTAEAQSFRPDDEERKRKFEDKIHFEFSEHGYSAQFERDKEMWYKTFQQPQDERIANILRRIFTILRYGGLMYREDRHSGEWKVWKDTRWSIATVLSHGGRVLVQIPKAGTVNTKLVVLGDANRNRANSDALSPPNSAKIIPSSPDTTEPSILSPSSKEDASIENLDAPTTSATTQQQENIELNHNSATNSGRNTPTLPAEDKTGSKLNSKRNSSNSAASWSSEYSENISASRRGSVDVSKVILDEPTPVDAATTQQQPDEDSETKIQQDEGQKNSLDVSVEMTISSVEEQTTPPEMNDDTNMETAQQQSFEDFSVPTSPQMEEEEAPRELVQEGEDSSLNLEDQPTTSGTIVMAREPRHERKISLKLDLEKLNFHTHSQMGSQSVPTPSFAGSATDEHCADALISPPSATTAANSTVNESVGSSSVSSPTGPKDHPSRSQTLKPNSRRKTIFSGLFGKKKNNTLTGPLPSSSTTSDESSSQPQLAESSNGSSKSPKAAMTPRTEKKKKGFFRFFSKPEKTEVTEKDFWKWLITGDPHCSDKELLKFITLSTSGDQCMEEKRVVFKRVAGSHGITYKRKKKNKDNEHGILTASSSSTILVEDAEPLSANQSNNANNNDYDSEEGGDYEMEEDLETISNLSDEELEFEKCPFGRTKILMEIKPFGLNSKNSKLVGYSTTTQLRKHRHWGMNIPLGGYKNIAQGMYKIPIEANGRHGHIYFNYMAPTAKHNGGLLIGCESSEYGKTGQNGEMHTIGAHSSTISVTHGYKWRNKICSLENISSVGTPDNLDSMFVDLSYTGWEFLMQCEWKDEFVKESPAELAIRDQNGNLFLPPSDPDEEEWF